jgi:hypothetical protein
MNYKQQGNKKYYDEMPLIFPWTDTNLFSVRMGGRGVEYLHRSPASRGR